RRRHTRSKRDWSSDVCSSDLSRSTGHVAGEQGQLRERVAQHPHRVADAFAVSVGSRDSHDIHAAIHQGADVIENAVAVEVAEGRSEERRVGKEGRARVWQGGW